MDASGIVNVGLTDSSADNAAFCASLDAAKKSNPFGAFVDSHTPEELDSSRAKTLLSGNRKAGVAVEQNGNITGVFKDGTYLERGVARDLLISAIANGGDRLDCYVDTGHSRSSLLTKYTALGFIPVARMDFNPEYAIGWDAQKYGTPPVVVFMHNGDGAEAVAQKAGTYHVWNMDEVSKLPLFTDYDAAMSYRDSLIEKRKAVSPEGSVGAAKAGFDPYSHAANTYGAIAPGENPARVVDIPVSMDGKTRVSQYARTTAEAGITPDTYVQNVEKLVTDGKLSHTVYTDEAALQNAADTISRKGQLNAYTDFLRAADKGKVSKDLVSMGTTLYADAVTNNDYQAASEIFLALSDMETKAGQSVQAARLMKLMTPEGRVWTVNSMVQNLQDQINKGRPDGKKITLNLDDSLVSAYQNATTEEAQAKAMDDIYRAVGQQIPTTFGKALQKWRYFSMLASPSTHLRNLSGNVGMGAMKLVKDNLAAGMESGLSALGVKMDRTKGFLNPASGSDRALISTAWNDYANVEDALKGVGKYTDTQKAEQYSGAWKLNDPKTKVGRAISRVMQAAETVPNANAKLLDVEDLWFSRPAYTASLASYMKANGQTEITDAARDYAIKEAQKATFRDANAVSSFAKKMGSGSKVANAITSIVFPFRATPANVGVRALEYSPAGLAKTITYDTARLAKGDITASQYIDSLASGMTGTGLMALGIVLAKAGILRATGVGDEKEKEQQKLEGAVDYSIDAGGRQESIGFISPASAPLLTGAAMYEAMATKDKTGNSYTADDYINALSGILDPVMETSMLSGLDSILSAVRSTQASEGDATLLSKLGVQLAGNYLSSLVPTVLSKTANALDASARKSYTDKNSPVPASVQAVVQSLQRKVPGQRETLMESVDAWGRVKPGGNTGDVLGSAWSAVRPNTASTATETDVDAENKRLYDKLGDIGDVFPKAAPKTIGDAQLTAEQYTAYQKSRGRTDYDVRAALIELPGYAKLSDSTKADAMRLAAKYANEVGKEAAGVGYKADTAWIKSLMGAKPKAAADTILQRAIIGAAEDTGDKYAAMASDAREGSVDAATALAVLPASTADKYYEYAKPENVAPSAVLDALSYKNSQKAKTEYGKDGKAVEGKSTQDKMIAYIDGLKLSDAKKRALYCCFYAESGSPW